MNRLIALFFICALCVGNAAWAGAYDNKIIERIEVSGEDGAAVQSRMKLKVGDVFTQADFDIDLKNLVKDYDRVEPSVDVVNGQIQINLKVWPKPVIRAVNWDGNTRIKSKSLQKELGIGAKKIYDRQEFNKAFHKVKAYYVKKGFFEAQLDYRVDYNVECNEVEINVCINEGRAGKIKKIVFVGLDTCEESELLDLMVTKKFNFFMSWLDGSGTYVEDMIMHDKFIILNHLQNLGYADATVNIEVVEAEQCERILVIITVEKGPIYTFGKITFSGNTEFADERVQEQIKICEGKPFSTEEIHNTITRLTNFFGKYGYIDSFINFEPTRVGCENIYDVHFTINEDKQYFVGLIKVIGNCTTQTKVILHETMLVPGEVFNSIRMQQTEIRLQNIGYFKNVNVYAVKSEGPCILPENYRDVHIEVEETSTGNMGAFAGFSTAESLFGGLNITESNFNINGFSRVWEEGPGALRGGGEYAHITATFGQKTTSYVLSWTKPYFRDTAWSVGFDIETSRNYAISKDYDLKNTGFTLHGTYMQNAFVKIGTHYRMKYASLHISNHKNYNEKSWEEKRKLEESEGLLSAIGYSWLYDSTDHPRKPTSGFKSRLDGEFAGVGGKHTFLSFAYINSWFYDVWGYAIFKVRADARFIQPLCNMHPDQVPLDERFFLGGDNQIRGYRPFRLGPKLNGDNDEPKGGISMQLASLELSKCLFSRVESFIFIDSGHLSDNRWNFGKMYSSAGFGARIQVLDGTPPVTLGFGFPLNHANSSDIKRFFLTIGGKF